MSEDETGPQRRRRKKHKRRPTGRRLKALLLVLGLALLVLGVGVLGLYFGASVRKPMLGLIGISY